MLVQIELTQEEIKLLLLTVQSSLQAKVMVAETLNQVRETDLFKLYRKLIPLTRNLNSNPKL